MGHIAKQRQGNTIYLYESISFRDSRPKPHSRRKYIGKIVQQTGEPVFHPEFLKAVDNGISSISRQKLDEFITKNINTVKDNNANQNKSEDKSNANTDWLWGEPCNTCKSYGATYLLKTIAKKIGLLSLLEKIFPRIWKEIFVLASYLIMETREVSYCDYWLKITESFLSEGMSSQRTSDLLTSFSFSERISFYQEWFKLIYEKEYVALDITSISSYSQEIPEVESGYNRDHEKLPQINLCMLFGEKSGLPIYQTIYNGSLKDVSTLDCTLGELMAVIGESPVMIVMDKGFYSLKNLQVIKKSFKSVKYLIGVPFTNKIAKKQVQLNHNIVDIDNLMDTSDKSTYGKVEYNDIDKSGLKDYIHTFFNDLKASSDRRHLHDKVKQLAEKARFKLQTKEDENDAKQYLQRTKLLDKDEYNVSVKKEVVLKELQTSGWLILYSDHIDDPQIAINIYRNKDVVEKCFYRYKNSLGLDRLHVHSNERMQNKVFIIFISMILTSYIQNIMKKNNLYKQMTLDELLIKLSTIKAVVINGKHIVRPITKEQKSIFSYFNMSPPV
jgi:transposase